MRTRLFLLLPVLLAACQWTPAQQQAVDMMMDKSSAPMMQDEGMMEEDNMMKDDSMMNDDNMMGGDKMMKDTSGGTSMMNDKPTMAPKGAYVTGVTGAEAIAKGEPAVLFFHAPWCPKCVKIDPELAQLFASEEFPMSLYKIDYDTEKELRAKYGVTYQHTFVLVTGLGEEVRVIQGPTIDQVRELLRS